MTGQPLFGQDIAKLLYDNMKGQLLSATLHVVTPGTRTIGALTSGTNPSTANKTAEGFIDDQNRRYVAGTAVAAGMVVIVLLGNSIQDSAVPSTSDSVTIEGTRYRIAAVQRDPAGATYTLLCKVV